VLWEVLAGLSLPEHVEVAAGAELHDKAGEPVGLKVRVQSGQERVVQQLEDLSLRLRATQLPPALQRRLVHHLHREPAGPCHVAISGASPAELRQVHRPDVAAPEPPQQPEAAHREGSLARARREDGLPPGVAALVRLPRAAAAAAAVAPAAAVAGRAAADAGLGAAAGDGAARRDAGDRGRGAGAVDAAVWARRAARRPGRVPRDDWLRDRLLPAVDSDKDGVRLVHWLRRVARPGEGAPRRRVSVRLVVPGRNANPDLVELELKNLLRHLTVSVPCPAAADGNAAHLELERLRDEPKLEVLVLSIGSRIQGRLQHLGAEVRVRSRLMFGVL
jgi:hypothetical protein